MKYGHLNATPLFLISVFAFFGSLLCSTAASSRRHSNFDYEPWTLARGIEVSWMALLPIAMASAFLAIRRTNADQKAIRVVCWAICIIPVIVTLAVLAESLLWPRT